jgi:hypothetical protein
MDAPTPEEVRARSELLKARYPEPEPPEGEGDPPVDPLLIWIEDAVALVASLTCRAIGPEGTPGEEVPAYMIPLAKRAVTMKVERLIVQLGSRRERQASAGSSNLRGFRAGSYSEDYFGPDEAMKARRLDPDQQTHEVLWALTTEECREAWLALWDPENSQQPAALASAFEWSNRPGSY